MTTPAQTIIEKFGGHQNVADACGLDLSRVYRWTYDEDRGGTGGRIPGRHQETLLSEAAKRGISLLPSDFFASENEAA